jgi:Na+/melibiose symporter-like transporter
MNFPDALSQSAIQSSLAKFFTSGEVRAQAISLRNKFGNFSIPVVTLIMGLIISFVPRSESQIVSFYQLFFVMSFLVGLAEVFVFKKFRYEQEYDNEPKPDYEPNNEPNPDNEPKPDYEPNPDNEPKPDYEPDNEPNPDSEKNTEVTTSREKGVIKSVLTNKVFLNYLLFTLIYYVTWQSGWALSTIYQIENLGANEIWLALFAVGSGLTSFFSAAFWSKYIAKKGNGRAMVMAGYALALNMTFIALTPNLPLMVLACCYGGFAGIGINITLLHGLLIATPEKDRMVYIGTYNTFVNISLGVSPMLSLLLVNKIGIEYTMHVVGLSRVVSASLLLLAHRKKLIGSE